MSDGVFIAVEASEIWCEECEGTGTGVCETCGQEIECLKCGGTGVREMEESKGDNHE